MDLRKFFEGERAHRALEALKEEREELHAARLDREAGGIELGVLGPPGEALKGVQLSGLDAKVDLVGRLAVGNEARRGDLIERHRVELYSIVLAKYRPGPAFRRGHRLLPGGLKLEVTPGGQTWEDYLNTLDAGWRERVAFIARQCWRLDRQGGGLAGSGSLLENGAVLTARHVIFDPGWLFGNPPAPATMPSRVRYGVVDAMHSNEDVSVGATAYLSPALETPDLGLVGQEDGWHGVLAASVLAAEFGDPPGLELEAAEFSVEELRKRPVAVIGHPISGNYGGAAAEVPSVFGDADLGLKRFMPGLLDDQTPLVEEGGQFLLNHNCSTLGGASGACLIDLRTGKILGVHVAGHARGGNRAVPSWIVAKKLAEAGLV